MDFESLPYSLANSSNIYMILADHNQFTFVETIDSYVLYKRLTDRLTKLEKSLTTNAKELVFIQKKSEQYLLSLDHKEDILLRVRWLQRLYDVKNALPSVVTKEDAKRLLNRLSSVPKIPLKSGLVSKLSNLLGTLPEESVKKVKPTLEDELMKMVIDQAGDEFINLGNTGRKYVIRNTVLEHSNQVNIERIRELSIKIEHQAKELLTVNDSHELMIKLENLPLDSYKSLFTRQKKEIVDRLIMKKSWNGLLSLDSEIKQINKNIVNEEQRKEREKYISQTKDGLTTSVLHLEVDIENIVKIDS